MSRSTRTSALSDPAPLLVKVSELGESLALTSVLAPLWVGTGLIGVFYLLGGSGWEKVGGYVTMASSFTAFYAASAMLMAGTFGRVILPLGKFRKTALRELFIGESGKPGEPEPAAQAAEAASTP